MQAKQWHLELTAEVLSLLPQALDAERRVLSLGAIVELFLALRADSEEPALRVHGLCFARNAPIDPGGQLRVSELEDGELGCGSLRAGSRLVHIAAQADGVAPIAAQAARDLEHDLRVPDDARRSTLPGAAQAAAEGAAFVLDPAYFDSALHCAVLLARELAQDATLVVTRIGEACVLRRFVAPAEIVAFRREGKLEVALRDRTGALVARLAGIECGSPALRDAQARELAGEAVRSAVSSSLSLAALAADDDLLALGAKSLDFVRIADALDGLLGFAPRPEQALQAASVTKLVDLYLATCARSICSRVTPPRQALAEGAAQELSPIELQLWFLETFGQVGSSYNEHAALRLRGNLDVAALSRALLLLEQRHPALRTRFVRSSAPWETPEAAVRKRVEPAHALPLVPVQVRGATPEEREAAAGRLIQAAIADKFALDERPAWRRMLVQLGPQDHVLLVVAHHIVCDGWSFDWIVRRELAQDYARALSCGSACDAADEIWPEPSTPAFDREQGLAFHREQLRDVPHVVDLAFDRPRPQQQSHRGSVLRFELGRSLWREVSRVAREQRVTPYVILLAAYQVLIARHSGQERFCLGTPMSLRDGAGSKTSIGCAVNLCPIRAEVDSGRSVSELLQSVRDTVLAVSAHSELPFNDVVRDLSPTRTLSHSPLVQVVFGWRQEPTESYALEGLDTQEHPVHGSASKFDLALEIRDHGVDATATLEYATELFDPGTVERLAARFQRLLAAMLRSAAAPLSELELDVGERARLAAWNATATTVAPPRMNDALRRVLADPPSRVAVRCGAEALSYAELAERVARAVRELREHGVAPGTLVALMLERSLDWIVLLAAFQELDVAYLPIDRSNPPARIARLLTSSGASAVIMRDPMAITGASFWRSLDTTGTAIAMLAPAHATDAGAHIYGIATSGSTGEAKVAAVTRAGFDNLLAWYAATLQLRADDRVCAVTSIGFDLTQKNVFAALCCGAELVICPEGWQHASELVDCIEQNAVTVLNCTPSLFYLLLAEARLRYERIASLRMVVLGGEPIALERLREWWNDPSCGARVMNSYGPSECSDVVCAGFVERAADPRLAVTIGRPIQNTRCHVVDRAGQPAPVGVPGELVLAGACVGSGYIGDPALTEQKFPAQLAQAGELGRCYRTGDLVRWNDDGTLSFLARLDGQRKVRGYRIDLGDVESAMRAQAGVTEAVACVVGEGTGRERLVGFVVAQPSPAARFDRAELKRRLAHILPSYMVPGAIHVIDAVPLTASGKVDRNALAGRAEQRVRSNTPGERGHLVALDMNESMTLTAFRTVLRRTDIELDDDFFELGGHSILAIELVAELERLSGERIPLTQVFELPTPRALASALGARLAQPSRLSDARSAYFASVKPGA